MPAVVSGADRVLFGDLRVIFGSSSATAGTFYIKRNGVDITPQSEWDATWTESVEGAGTATVTVQNRAGIDALDFHESTGAPGTRDIIKFGSDAPWVFFEGELIDPVLDLPVGFPWRRWKLSCTDWNPLLDERLVGVPQGDTWYAGITGAEFPNGPIPIDPAAAVSSTDRATIQAWFANYVRAPDTGSFDTGTFVNEYITNLFNDRTSEPIMEPAGMSVKAALSELAGYASFPIYAWIDPDRKYHWIAFPPVTVRRDGLLTLRFPQPPPIALCPVEITDVSPNGTTSVGARGLQVVPSRSYAPQEAYVNGVTSFIYNNGAVIYQGTGWGHSSSTVAGHSASHRQIAVDGQAIDAAQRDAIADSYTAYSLRPRLTLRVTIGGRDDEGAAIPIPDGFRAGQLIRVTDARLPVSLNGLQWPIQRITGSLQVARTTVRKLVLECGDAPLGRFSAKYRAATGSTPAAKRAAPNHALYFETLNPKPGEVQTVTSQLRDDNDITRAAPGIPVHWEFVSVTDFLGADKSGNGETLDPVDAVTDKDGRTTTQFAAGSLAGIYYEIEASTPRQ